MATTDDLQDQLQQLHAQVRQLQQQLNQRFDQWEHLLPIRLCNAVASFTAPLIYPSGIVLPANAPSTKVDLMFLDVAPCEDVAAALNLPVLLQDTPLSARRQQIIDYLGATFEASDHIRDDEE